MKKRVCSISMLKALSALLPFILIPAAAVFVFVFLHEFAPIGDALEILLPWYFVPVFAGGIVLHELLHGVFWKFAAGIPFKQIAFGFQLKTLTLVVTFHGSLH